MKIIDNLEMKKRFYESLNERQKRHFLAIEAKGLGRGGITFVSKAFESSRTTIHEGIQELDSGARLAINRVRKEGGGRKKKF